MQRLTRFRQASLVALAAGACTPLAAESLWLDELDASLMRQAWGVPRVNLSVAGRPLSMGGTTFQHGLGTHANSEFFVDLKGSADRFTARVGVDDCAADAAGLRFLVYGDGRLLLETEQLHAGGEGVALDLDVSGVRQLALIVDDCDNGDKEDKADWAEARISYQGAAPVAIPPPCAVAVGPLTPAAGAAPRINAAQVIGVRPGSPLSFAIPATGEEPLEFSATGLPPGLALDARSGRLSGRLAAAGEHVLTLQVRNRQGMAQRELRIVCGERLALTPPMGWTSRSGGAEGANQQRIQAAADMLVASGLIRHGWSYVCIDDGWQGTRQAPGYALQASLRFPDMAGLGAYIHGLGLRFGLYSTPWRTSFQGCTGGSADDQRGGFLERGNTLGRVSFCSADAAQFAAWGADLVRYEWRPMDLASAQECARCLRSAGRDMVLELANGAQVEYAREYGDAAACVQTTGETPDRWSRVLAAAADQEAWRRQAGPGRWQGLDILLAGLGGAELHPASGLTEQEQVAQFSLWCLHAAPLFVSFDPQLLTDAQDPRARFLLGLLGADEVIEVDQDPLGRPARRIRGDDDGEVWLKEMADGSRVVGLFNRSGLGARSITASWDELGLAPRQQVRDLWRQQDLGTMTDAVGCEVGSHGVALLRLRPSPP